MKENSLFAIFSTLIFPKGRKSQEISTPFRDGVNADFKNRYFRLVLNLSIFITGIIGLTSCEERIDLKLSESYTRIVVEGEITTEAKAHKVKLTTSSSYFYNEKAPIVSGATVSISDNIGNTYPLIEIPVGSGLYYTATDVQGVVGRTYTLRIEDVDINKDGKKEVYYASDLIKHAPTMDSLSFDIIEKGMNHGGPIKENYEIKGWVTEPATSGDFYLWKYTKNSIPQCDTVRNQQFTDDLLVNGNYIPGFSIFKTKAIPGDTIVVETRAITKGYYDYIVSFMLETEWNMGGGGFGGPPANIKTNISSGGLGWFSASDVTYKKAVIPMSL